MGGRFGTGADVLIHMGAMEDILSFADRAVSDDVRVGAYLGGNVGSDDDGMFFEIDRMQSSSEGAVGFAVTSLEPGTSPSDDDLCSASGIGIDSVLIIVDPYACEFSVYRVHDGIFSVADAVMVE